MLENEKRATDLNRQRMVLLQKVQTLQKLLSNSRSSLRAVGDKVGWLARGRQRVCSAADVAVGGVAWLQAKELQGEVLFRTTVINKQVESINKVRAQVNQGQRSTVTRQLPALAVVVCWGLEALCWCD